jgi:hypothetical protein
MSVRLDPVEISLALLTLKKSAGFCACIPGCKITNFRYEHLAYRENDDLQETIKLSNAKVSVQWRHSVSLHACS